ncbi:MAG: O-antigen ligase family protein [Lautropia sp.]|nr:O-antigen ligase family protein [Lautropia sp.]
MSFVNITQGLLALYLMTLLVAPKVQTPLVALVCLLAILGGQWRQSPALRQRVRQGWAMLLPLTGYAALFSVQIMLGWLRWRDWDQVLICALSAGVLLSSLPARGPAMQRWLLPAAALGALGALGLACWQHFHLNILRPYGYLGAGAVGSGALKYGDLSAMLALFSLQLLLRGQGRARRLLGGLGGAAGLGAVALTQARGAMLGIALALFAMTVLWYVSSRIRRRDHDQETPADGLQVGRRPRWRYRLMLMTALTTVILAGTADYMGARFADIGPQIERFQAGDNNSEVGQRLALWGIALRAARHAPLTGVGFDGFGAETRRQRETGELARDALVLYEGPHNEYLAGLASAGGPGLCVIILFFWAPLGVACRRFLRGQKPDEALSLVLLSASYAGFAMTDALFDRQISLLAYMLLASWLLSASRCYPSVAVPRVPYPEDVGAGVPAAAGGVHPMRPQVPGGLSVAIITRDEAHCIARCLRSVAFADQIVVLDSGSTDDTVTIARSLGAEVEVTDWPGFGAQKNRALARCRHRWVLSIDADEQVSEPLATELLRVLCGPDRLEQQVAGYWLRRSSRYCGRVIRHGLWGNDRVLRVFERERGYFTATVVHERLMVDGLTRTLDGILVHDSVDSPDDARHKARQYAFLGAQALRERGRGGTLRGGAHAAWTFVRGYLLRAGFLDGRYGLTLACLTAAGTFWKYHWAALPETKWHALQAVFDETTGAGCP